MKERGLTRFASKGISGNVDHEKGIIYGVSVLTVGEASGHGLFVDEVTLGQALEQGVGTEPTGLKSRFDHPNACSRSMGAFIGRVHSFRLDGNKLRGDLHLADIADKSPDGKLKTYVLGLAEEDPEAFGTSIVFRHAEAFKPDESEKGTDSVPDKDDAYWFPHARIAKLQHCDVVDESAANNGLFGRLDYVGEQVEKWADENQPIVGKIISSYYARKQKKEDEKMGDAINKEMEIELSTVRGELEAKTTELATATGTIETLTSEADGKLAAAKDEGKTEALALVTARVEQFEDQAFVIETIAMSDSEVKDEYITRLKAGKIKVDGENPLEFSEGVEGEEGTFEAKVAEKVETGMAKKDAISACSSEFPKLHDAYNKRMTDARK